MENCYWEGLTVSWKEMHYENRSSSAVTWKRVFTPWGLLVTPQNNGVNDKVYIPWNAED